MRGVRVWLLACTVLTAAPLPAIAQAPPDTEQSDVVIITAQKRAQDIQDVPVAVTALGGEALQDLHVTDIRDLNALAPSLQIKTDDNAANPKIFIRGIGLNDFNPNTASAVAIYTDGVYIGSPLAQMGQFFDLDRVEVLRGPQGTLYGRNTTGGAINLISRKPTDEFDANASIEYGSYNGVTVEGAVGGPISSTLAYRAAGTYVTNDGYTLNRLTGNRGNDTDRGSARFSLAWTPSDTFDALFQLRYGRSKGGSILAYNRSLLPQTAGATGPDGFCAPAFYTSGDCTDLAGYANTSTNLYQGDYHLEGKDEVETFGGSATLTWDLGAMSLISVTGYDHADRDDLEDTDAGPTDIITARYQAKQWAASEELRLQSNGDNTLNWVAGIYLARDELESNSYYDVFRVANSGDPATDLPQGIGVFGWPFTQDTDSYAVFGQADYKVTDKLTATLGLRYSADDKTFHYDSVYSSNVGDPTFNIFPTVDDSRTFDSLSGKLGLQYAVNDDVNLYASYNRGYKSGGFFGGQTTDPAAVLPYNDEVVNAYEVGLKSELLDNVLTANFAAFFYDYQDLQVYTLVVDSNTNLTVQNFTNASNAEVSGLEAELIATPIDGLDLSLGASFLDATYKDFSSAGDDYSGNTLPNAPEASLTGSARYEWSIFGGSAEAQADVSYRSKVFYDTRNVERLSDDDRTFVNLRFGWKPGDGGMEFGVFGRNVTGETNVSDIIPIEGLGFDLFSVGPRETAGVYARFDY
ncbi:MAG: TonB-dependent receptor [Hyphomonadaceae bacterium]|nr:TonB-dependent receptor [Hyphomonadaceae bacterium]